ncbi:MULTISPECIES: 5-bromo-4-chloroindolyl phosphate hydrolysis family protein [unclassified Enterococcus]|uniref:5-bromo-4-chloroindolyl phosphate hydrolysis family protein n=1 Tax=unclassified Enterococcus TaxID=2608891 RepID=UPI001552928F|nr:MULTISPECIES: 5-bromo-4-chloroindolyl phosphate hydrolysis family protein [unclassified Enterococcus]MBS7576822.1 5-bromo-4-chloroindolyl phosphate hydrolysis family protein [Enterococcus sp. MMGLQ5-2]MBS7584229.1 5-bromo-4-chloroindolyl phosphate hydrolysis family protein [Enterococcus sp. MMGLQ5-1]NPD12085.1 5-bromo-4-chloroindolyl phosphate hydrolysis protein [Enterococcus sp. MMGLQ5-1]NPD36657.1 5-bromo-4-chloroindolyl phosphate hydrolysis protein [Enterococcus sp. MMGLQ5-2]
MSKKKKIIIKILITFLILMVLGWSDEIAPEAFSDLATMIALNAIFWTWSSFKTTIKWFLPVSLLIIAADISDSLTGFLAIGLIIYYAIFAKKGHSMRQKAKSKKTNSEKEKLYHEAGLNEQDIKAFRNTMAEAKQNIIDWEANVKQNATLKKIEKETQGIIAAKALFKEIVEEPKRITEVDTFLYKRLPNIVNLTEKYLKITAHKIKAESTIETLKKSEEVIQKVSIQISNDYTKFVSDDLEDLTIEAEVAKENLKN